jgi:hypothetical protein
MDQSKIEEIKISGAKNQLRNQIETRLTYALACISNAKINDLCNFEGKIEEALNEISDAKQLYDEIMKMEEEPTVIGYPKEMRCHANKE